MSDTSKEIIERILKQPAVRKLLQVIDTKWQPIISKYVATLPDVGILPSRKSVKDSVWGMIDLSGQEVVIVDSPLLQRLRWIRQLGVTYLTFPTADYSRFEHVLGVAHQASRMLDALSTRSTVPDNEKLRKMARLAGLLHDIGHMPYSHLTERYLKENPDSEIEDALEEVSAELEVEVKHSEFISFMFVQAPSFKNLLINNARYEMEEVNSVSLAVLGGVPPDFKILKQIVSNILDADKLDYMFRDAHYTGVPLPVDLERLLYKLKCLPEKAKTVKNKEVGGLLAVDLGGSHLIEDLLLSRRILSRQVYAHHKTLAAERLVIEILRENSISAIDLILEDDTFFSESNKKLEKSKTDLENLKYRNLPRRAMVISYGQLPRRQGEAAADVDSTNKERWSRFQSELGKRGERERLANKMLQKSIEIIKVIGGDENKIDKFYVDGGSLYRSSLANDLLVEYPDGSISEYEMFPARAAAFAHSPEEYMNIFYAGPKSSSNLAHVVAEQVFYEEYGMYFGRNSADNAKISHTKCDEIKRKIEQESPDWYSSCRAIRPAPDLAPFGAHLRKIIQKFGSYGMRPGDLSDEHLRRYLGQFSQENIPKIIKMLEAIEYVDDRIAGEELASIMVGGAADGEVYVPVTGLNESGAVMSYYLKQHGISSSSINEALDSNPNYITFYEDSCFSGKQAATKVLNWFGKKGLSRDDECNALNAEHQKALLNAKRIRFCFMAVSEGGKNVLINALKEVGIVGKSETPIILDQVVMGVKNFGDDQSMLKKAFTDSDDYPVVSKLLGEIGTELLMSTKRISDPEKWSEARCGEYALGYSDIQALVVFQRNTPTATLTPLWIKGGVYLGEEWFPLFPRAD